jgi:hypothetical protein
MLRVTNKLFILAVILMNVVKLSVLTPNITFLKSFFFNFVNSIVRYRASLGHKVITKYVIHQTSDDTDTWLQTNCALYVDPRQHVKYCLMHHPRHILLLSLR